MSTSYSHSLRLFSYLILALLLYPPLLFRSNTLASNHKLAQLTSQLPRSSDAAIDMLLNLIEHLLLLAVFL